MKQEILKRYAELITHTGVNIQKGQSVVIRVDVSLANFASIVAEECYRLGAKLVSYEWQCALTSRLNYLYGDKEALKVPTPMEIALQKYEAEELPVLIWLDGDDPDGYRGVDGKLLGEVRAAKLPYFAKYIEEKANKYQWTIVGVPTIPWAKKVFPNLDDEEALEALWEAVLKAARADDGNGIKNWEGHEKNLKEKCAHINKMQLRELHYKASNGTDLHVGLIPGVEFLAGGEKTLSGTFFQPNIPSEECFTSPMRGKAEGVVHSSKPLVYQGQVIEDFYFVFKDGKAVEAHAKKGEAALQSILNIDEGSAYLGECALVPYDSPINESGLLFYNTLFDENASCHLALGKGFTNLYPGFEKYTEEEIHQKGINKSLSHVDFMIGTRDLEIVGIDSFGKEVLIFKNGTWAF